MLNKLENKIKYIFRYKIVHSEIIYSVYKFLIDVINFKNFFRKKRYFLRDVKNFYSLELKKKGYVFLEERLCKGLRFSDVNNLINIIINRKKINIEKNKAFTKLATTEDILCIKECFDFLTHQEILKIIGSYLGETPQILHTQVWYSNNQRFIEGTSQEFHLDHEDGRQVKLFLFLETVSEDNGPLQLINKSKSRQIIKETKYQLTGGKPKRLKDIDIKSGRIISCTGEQNSVLLVDTTKVLHRGSLKSSKPRIIFMAQYVTKYSTSKNKDIINKNYDNVRSDKIRLFIEKDPSLKNKKQYLKFII
tara:strand:- start:34998 stop:35915 length:918 start_codon:yes stop_codon:yes gene_type:complete